MLFFEENSHFQLMWHKILSFTEINGCVMLKFRRCRCWCCVGGQQAVRKLCHYDVLGVSQTATAKEIKSAYVDLAKKYHPDHDPDSKNSHQRFVKINEAYEILSKPESRKVYDLTKAGLNTPPLGGMRPAYRYNTDEEYRSPFTESKNYSYRRYNSDTAENLYDAFWKMEQNEKFAALSNKLLIAALVICNVVVPIIVMINFLTMSTAERRRILNQYKVQFKRRDV